MERRLAAIMATDIVGYSAMMTRNEAATLRALKDFRAETFDPAVDRHRGRIVKLMGDGALVEFASVVDAVQCAIDLQTSDKNIGDEAIRLRIGIHVGDIILDDDDIFGDGVNIAARLEPLSETGGICLSEIAVQSLGNRVDVAFSDLGEKRLKNIDRPVRIFGWLSPDQAKNAAAPVEPKSEKPSIAVLAFDNMSGDPEQEYFSDGIAEDIITELSHFREFFVIARNSSFTYKGTPIRVDEVCRELGVRYLLEGSVRKAGNRVRVTAQLINGETGSHLWAEKFDRDLDDIFAVQDEITGAIVAAVAPNTIGAEVRRSHAKHPESLSAWEKVLQARWHIGKLTEQDNESARRWLMQAAEADPGLSAACSTLAFCELYGMLHFWRRDTRQAIADAVEASRKAIALDENDANAHAMLGMSEFFARDYDSASRHLERAIRLNPNHANAYGILAAVHGVAGDYDAAAASAEQAISLSPQDPLKSFWLGGVGIGAFVAERYQECLDISRQVLAEFPGYASSMRQEAAALAMMGREQEAREACERLLKRMPDLTVSQVRHMVPVRHPDDHERWLEGLRRAGLPE